MTLIQINPKGRTGLGDRWASLAYLPRIFISLWRTDAKLTSLIIVTRFAGALQIPLMLFIAKLIVDQLITDPHMRIGGNFTLISQMKWIIFLAFIELTLAILGVILNRSARLCEQMLSTSHGYILIENLILHSAKIDLTSFETPANQDRIQRANAAAMLTDPLINSISLQYQNVVTIVGFVGILASISQLMVLLLIVSVIPLLIAEDYFNGKHYEASIGMASDRRRLSYFQQLGTSLGPTKEIRLFNLSPFIIARCRELAGRIVDRNRALLLHRTAWSGLANLLSISAYYSCYVFLILGASNGNMSVGNFVFAAATLLRLNSILDTIIVGISQLSGHAQFIKDYFLFIDSRLGLERIDAVKFPSPLSAGITLENVGFRYPGTENWVVRNLNMFIPVGKHVALSGENGAGKTTIIKLITGLYYPTEGRILFDGVDVRAINRDDLYDKMSSVFQDFVKYNFTVAENIGVGRIDNIARRQEIEEAAQKSSADDYIAGLPGGFDQQLGVAFNGGVDLSGGQWQRLALARAYFRNAPILILDEPSSALDPRSEYELFRHFARLGKGRTTISVSHRMASVRKSDKIFVIAGGCVTEQGTHEELMLMCGIYAEIFEMQSSGYK